MAKPDDGPPTTPLHQRALAGSTTTGVSWLPAPRPPRRGRPPVRRARGPRRPAPRLQALLRPRPRPRARARVGARAPVGPRRTARRRVHRRLPALGLHQRALAGSTTGVSWLPAPRPPRRGRPPVRRARGPRRPAPRLQALLRPRPRARARVGGRPPGALRRTARRRVHRRLPALVLHQRALAGSTTGASWLPAPRPPRRGRPPVRRARGPPRPAPRLQALLRPRPRARARVGGRPPGALRRTARRRVHRRLPALVLHQRALAGSTTGASWLPAPRPPRRGRPPVRRARGPPRPAPRLQALLRPRPRARARVGARAPVAPRRTARRRVHRRLPALGLHQRALAGSTTGASWLPAPRPPRRGRPPVRRARGPPRPAPRLQALLRPRPRARARVGARAPVAPRRTARRRVHRRLPALGLHQLALAGSTTGASWLPAPRPPRRERPPVRRARGPPRPAPRLQALLRPRPRARARVGARAPVAPRR